MPDKLATVNVVLVRDDVIEELIAFKDDAQGCWLAEVCFLKLCAANFTNWDEYTSDDIDNILAEGVERFGHGAIYLVHSAT